MKILLNNCKKYLIKKPTIVVLHFTHKFYQKKVTKVTKFFSLLRFMIFSS